MSANRYVWVVWWLNCLVWSTIWLVIKVGVSAVPPLSLAAVRLLLALAILIPIAAWRGHLRLPPRHDLRLMVGTGVLLFGLNYGLLFWGTQFVASGLVAVLQAGTPGIALLLAWMLGREDITLAKVLALAAGAAGVALIFVRQAVGLESVRGLGCAAIVFSAVCVAVAYVLMKDRGGHLNPITVMLWQLCGGAAPLLLLALWQDGNPVHLPWTTPAKLAVVYLALIGSVGAFWVNYWLLQRMDASALLFMGIVEAPIAAALGALFLHERLDAATCAGALLVLMGAALIVREQRRTSQAPPARA